MCFNVRMFGRSQVNRFIAEPNVVVGGVLIRQKRQRFGSCDPKYGLKHKFVTERMQNQCVLSENDNSRNLFHPFGADNVFLATSKAFNDLTPLRQCYDVKDKSQANQFDSPFGFHFMRHGGSFKNSKGTSQLAGGEGNEEYSYQSMEEARKKGEEVDGSYPVYFDARWSERQANKFTAYVCALLPCTRVCYVSVCMYA